MEVTDFYKKYLHIDNPFAHQIDLFKKIQAGIFPLILKSPTGSGKTEAVIAPFLYQFLENDFVIAPRLIYILPMRVLVNNTAQRIVDYAKRISANITVSIQHGDIPGSPFFMSDIVVTTLDQFIYAFSRASNQVGRHLDIPAGAIASSMVVFDEAHMYRDETTFSLMKALMDILNKSNIPFIVMTATMPDSLESSLFENIGLSEKQQITGGSKIKSAIKINVVDDKLIQDNKVNISNKILEKIRDRKTLIVMNQVKKAQKVYEFLKTNLSLSNKEIVLLHSQYTNEDKRIHEERALSLIPHKGNGKKVIPEGSGIVVATQVLEAGIDFSAELLITELAPADCLVQRAGRCARYDGEEGEMIIFGKHIQKDGEKDVEKDFLPYKYEDLKNTLEWLKANQMFDMKNFGEVRTFVDVLDYKANDYEANDSLIDLYECTLYADSKPENIQVRESKPVSLVIMELPVKKKDQKPEVLADDILNLNIKNSSVNVDIRVAWKLFKNNRIKWELRWRPTDNSYKPELVPIAKGGIQEKDARIVPFRKYILSKDFYSEEKGIEQDGSNL